MAPSFIDTDVVILGAGPAGLAAMAASNSLGLSTIALEAGPTLARRDRYDPHDIGNGVGGAGLFSDGKFSFHPAATALWRLEPASDLVSSYDWLCKMLAKRGLTCPPMDWSLVRATSSSSQLPAAMMTQKLYPSIYLSFDQRKALIRSLLPRSSGSVLTGAEASSIVSRGGKITVRCAPLAPNGLTTEVRAKALIACTGRFGPEPLSNMLPSLPEQFRRLEFGIRIEQPSQRFFLRDINQVDAKLVLPHNNPDIGWRTFCCCRDGEVITTSIHGVLSVSGRADVAATGRSNVGLLVRATAEGTAEWIMTRDLKRVIEPGNTVCSRHFASLADPTSSQTWLAETFGIRSGRLISNGLQRLVHEIGGRQFRDVTLHAPAIEGVGSYPRLGTGLKVARHPIWVAGDASGAFRGLTAAMMSGHFAGLQAGRYLTAAT